MTIPNLAGFTVGEKVTASKLTQHTKTVIEAAVMYKPFCHMQNATTQGTASGTSPIFVTLGTAVEDTDGMANTSLSRIVIQTAGVYRLTFQGCWAANATGSRAMFLWRNGSTVAAVITPAVAQSLITTSVDGSKTLRLAAGDFIQLGGWQTSGGTLNYDTTNGGCFLQAEWISL